MTSEMHKTFAWFVALVYTIAFVLSITSIQAQLRHVQSQISTLSEAVSSIDTSAGHDEIEADIQELREEVRMQIDEIQKEMEKIRKDPVSRAGGRSRIMWVTAYDLSYESCGKYPDHPEYGITASGERVREWYTIAAGPELPFGTEVYIPYFRDKPNGGVFVIKDRGGAVKNSCLDVYIADHEACDRFGLQRLEVYVLTDK